MKSNTLYTTAQRANLSDLLSKAKAQGTAKKVSIVQRIDKLLASFFFINASMMLFLLPIQLQDEVIRYERSEMFEPLYIAYLILGVISLLICFTTLRFILKK